MFTTRSSPGAYIATRGATTTLDLLRGQAGSAFDVRCVAALERVLATVSGFVPVPAVALAV